jgi:SAM-dependent methyltransferase
MAQAAKININYIVADLMTWDSTVYVDHFDFVVMELGILHYFVDLVPLFALIQRILSPGGHYVLHEFHPFSRKGNPKKEGDRVYLDEEVVMARPTPYSFAFGEKEVADFLSAQIAIGPLAK